MHKLLEPFKLFDPEECDQIIDRAQDQLKLARTVGGYDTDIRSNRVAWLDFEDQGKFYDIMTNTDVDVRWLQHPYQVSRYDQGEFYDWHVDLIQTKRSSIRSLTLTCTLEPAPDATLEFESGAVDLPKGWAVLFDSETRHRANAPAQGTRWSFTIWGMRDNPDKFV